MNKFFQKKQAFRQEDGNGGGRSAKRSFRFLWPILILAAVIFLLVNSIVIIPSGYTGVVTTFGQIQERPMPNGFNWKIPFVQNVLQVSQRYLIEV